MAIHIYNISFFFPFDVYFTLKTLYLCSEIKNMIDTLWKSNLKEQP